MALDPKRIDQLPAASALTGAELAPIDQGGVTVHVTTQAIADLAMSTATALFPTTFDNMWNAVQTLSGTAWVVTGDDGGSYAPVDLSGNGTQNHPQNTGAATDLDAQAYRHSTASASPGNAGGFRAGGSAGIHYFKASASAAKSGGFRRSIIFGARVAASDCRAFFGECASSTSPVGAAADPSAAFNTFGIGKDAADTNLQFMHNNGAGAATKIDLGFTLAGLVGHVLRLDIYVPRGGAIGYIQLKDLSTDTTLVSTSTSTDLPTDTTSLDWCAALNSGTGSTSVSLGLTRVTLGYAD